MTSRVTFFSRTTSGAVKTWACWIEKDGVTVTSEWGIKGGKLQRTSDTLFGKQGKTAKHRAVEEHARQVLKKQRAGYVEAEAKAKSVRLEELKVDIDFNRLPRTFAPAKPIREIDLVEARRLDKDRKLYIQRKRDGMRHYIVCGLDGKIRVFSRGMDDLTEHFARYIQELTLPPGTILDAEFVVTTPEGADDFTAVSEICRSKEGRARQTMVAYERNGSEMRFFVFDLLFYDRLPTWQLPYEKRYTGLVEVLDKAHGKGRTHFYHVVPMPLLINGLVRSMEQLKKRVWEGLVLWRKDQATQVRMNRAPARVNCYKLKFMQEEDFIATGYDLGKGKNAKVVGALNLMVYKKTDKGTTVKMLLGNVGTGLDDKTRSEALRWTYPCVVQVRYEKMSDTGLRFPAFLRKRDDKQPKECTL